MSIIDDIFSLKQTVSVVTGGSQGNGLAIVEALAGAGSDVIVLDKNRDQDKINSLEFPGIKNVMWLKCDITNDSQVSDCLDIVKENYGSINILVNNAGVTNGYHSAGYPKMFWDQTMDVNLNSVFFLIQKCIPLMKLDNLGIRSIINVTSLNAEKGFPQNPAYVASKGALKQLTKALAIDLGGDNIRVNNLGPGYFKTSMTKKSWENPQKKNNRRQHTCLGRWGNPEDLMGAVIFLASPASNYVTGTDLYIDGGWLAKGIIGE